MPSAVKACMNLLERVWTLIGEYEPEADDSDEEVLYKPEVKADFEFRVMTTEPS